IDGGAIHANSRQLTRPARRCAIAAVAAATALTTRLAPVPAAALEATSRVAGRRRFPSTSPTSPPARATMKHHAAYSAHSTPWNAARVVSETLFDPSAGEPPRTRTGVPADQAPLAVRLRPRRLDE